MSGDVKVEVICEGCGASYEMNHSLDDRTYKIVNCAFCASEEIILEMLDV